VERRCRETKELKKRHMGIPKRESFRKPGVVRASELSLEREHSPNVWVVAGAAGRLTWALTMTGGRR